MRAARVIVERLKLSLIIAAALIMLMLVGVFHPMSDEEGREVEKMLREIGENNLELKIFSNNIVVALIGAIPLAGPPIAGYIVFNTGRFLGWISAQMGLPAELMAVSALIVILATGYGILEFLGYGIAIAESLTLSYYALRKRWLLRKELKILPLTLAFSALFLALGALIEAALIRSLGNIMQAAGII